MSTIEDFRKKLKEELTNPDFQNIFYVLKQSVKDVSTIYDNLNLLEGRYKRESHKQHIEKSLSDEDSTIAYNQIRAALLDIINSLAAKDLVVEIAASNESRFEEILENKVTPSPNAKGKILYRVPGLMCLEKKYKCIVRVAFTEEDLAYQVRRDDDTKMDALRIAEVMEISLIDHNGEPAFSIDPISSKEQFVDRGEYTEWIFYVKALLEGTYDLILKATVLEKRYEREIRKDIVLEKKITIVAEEISAEVSRDLSYAPQGEQVVMGGGGLLPALVFQVAQPRFILDALPFIPLSPMASGTGAVGGGVTGGVAASGASSGSAIGATALKVLGALAVSGGIYIAFFYSTLKFIYAPQTPFLIEIEGSRPPFDVWLKKNTAVEDSDSIYIDKGESTVINLEQQGFEIGDVVKIRVKDNVGNPYDTILLLRRFEKKISPNDTTKKNPETEIDFPSLSFSQQDSFILTILGKNPPFSLWLKRNKEGIYFDSLKLSKTGSSVLDLDKWKMSKGELLDIKLMDNLKNQIDTTVELTYSGPKSYGDSLPVEFDIIPDEINQTLRLKIFSAKPPFHFIVKNLGSGKQLLETNIDTARNTVVSYQKFNFPVKVLLQAKVTDARDSIKTKIFSLKGQPKPKPKLTLTCAPNKKLKRLRATVKGGEPPFKILIENQQVASLEKMGNHYQYYIKGGFRNGQEVKVSVLDKNDNRKDCTCQIEMPVCEVSRKPLQLTECFYFDQFEDCGILYVYRQESKEHQRMMAETFASCEVVSKFDDFKFFKMDASSITDNCDNTALHGLGNVTTWVENGKSTTPIKFDGYLSPEELLNILDCGEFGEKGVLELNFIPALNKTYRYESGQESDVFSVTLVEDSFRVQLAAIEGVVNFKKFIDQLKGKTMNQSIFIHANKRHNFVLLGEYENAKKAQKALERFSTNEKLAPLLKAAKINNLRVVYK